MTRRRLLWVIAAAGAVALGFAVILLVRGAQSRSERLRTVTESVPQSGEVPPEPSGPSACGVDARGWNAALGAPDELKPKDEDIISMELNEDLDTRQDQQPSFVDSTIQSVENPGSPEGPDFGDEEESDAAESSSVTDDGTGANIYASEDQQAVPFVRPFENLADLPADLSEAFESFKLSIIRHKSEEWQEISREDMLGTLEALKELTLAPASSSESSF